MWHYKLSNSDCIQRVIINFAWEEAFFNVNVNKKVLLVRETILNIVSNLIPRKIVTYGDGSRWMTNLIKKGINDKNLHFYKCFVENKGFTSKGSSLERERFHSAQNNLIIITETTKQQYFSKIANKISDPHTSSKTC